MPEMGSPVYGQRTTPPYVPVGYPVMDAATASNWLNIAVVAVAALGIIFGLRAKVGELVRTIERLTETIERFQTMLNEHETAIEVLRRDIEELHRRGRIR